ncbi:MAG TPA: hypothetical protein VF898_02750 [Chloroflexota bacterium]
MGSNHPTLQPVRGKGQALHRHTSPDVATVASTAAPTLRRERIIVQPINAGAAAELLHEYLQDCRTHRLLVPVRPPGPARTWE